MKKLLGVGLISSVVAVSAVAQNSGLVSIPIADTIGFREFELGHSVAGVENSKHYGHGGYALLGAYDRIELAFGTDYQKGNVWGIKAKAWANQDDTWAIGVGAQNITGSHNEPFAMIRHTAGNINLHAGWFNNDRDRAAFGIDTAFGDKLVLGLDHSTSAGGGTWLGAWYDLGNGFTLSPAVGYPNTRADGIQHVLTLSWTSRF